MQVLEHEHERLRLGVLLRPRARRPGELLLARVALDRREDPGGEPEQVGDGLDLARRAQLLEGLLGRLVVADAGRRLDHLGHGPVGDALAVGERAAEEGAHALERGGELADEPALADAGIAVDREEVRAPVADAAL